MHHPRTNEAPRRRELDRRSFLTAAAATVAAPAAMAAERPFFQRHKLPIGLQLYTLGDISKTLDATLSRVAAIGYRTVELAGFYGRQPAELRQALDRAGLRCTSAHIQLRSEQDYAKVAAQARVIGFDRVIQPIINFPPGSSLRPEPGETIGDVVYRIMKTMTPDQWKAQADQLNTAGAALKAEGLRVGYHTHNVEFAPLSDGQTGLEVLLKQTDPALVTFELDAGWVGAAGLDPVDWLHRYPGRFELMHVKDLQATTKPNFSFHQDPADVGAGIMNWPRILPAAYAAGVRRFFVEQEAPFTRDRLDAVATSFKYLNQLKA